MASNAFKQTVMELEQRRFRASDLKEQRTQEVYKKIPKLEEIRYSVSMTSMSITRALVSGEKREQLINELKENNIILKEQEKYLLTKHGYPEDYLHNVYTCGICEDRGFIDNKKCKCFEQLMIEKLYQFSNIREVLKIENFDTFDIRFFGDDIKIDGATPKQYMTNNFKVAQRFVDEFESVYKNIFMYGDVGRGKTFLCNCIAKEILDKGHIVLYASAIELFKVLENYRFHRDENKHNEEFIEYLTKADLLIIDDLGTEVQTQFTSSEIFNIINKRHTDRKHTIISTNIPLSEIETIYSHRLESRFMGNFELMKFVGEDIRLQKKFN